MSAAVDKSTTNTFCALRPISNGMRPVWNAKNVDNFWMNVAHVLCARVKHIANETTLGEFHNTFSYICRVTRSNHTNLRIGAKAVYTCTDKFAWSRNAQMRNTRTHTAHTHTNARINPWRWISIFNEPDSNYRFYKSCAQNKHIGFGFSGAVWSEFVGYFAMVASDTQLVSQSHHMRHPSMVVVRVPCTHSSTTAPQLPLWCCQRSIVIGRMCASQQC